MTFPGHSMSKEEIYGFIEGLRETTRDHPNDVVNYSIISELLYQAGDYEGAIAEANKALAIDPHSVEALKARGWAHSAINDRKKSVRALSDFEIALDMSPRDATLLARISMVCYNLGDYDRAILRASESIGLDPKLRLSWRIRAWAFFQKNELAKALADFKVLTSICPTDGLAYYFQGILHFKRAEYRESLDAFSQSLHIRPNHHEVLTQRAKANYFLQKFEDAKNDCHAALTQQPEFYEAIIWRGNSLRRLHRQAEALEDFARAIELQPRKPTAYLYRGTAYERWQQNDLAIADYTTAIELAPPSPDLYLRRGYLFIKLEDFPRARADLDKVISLEPGNETAKRARAQIADR